MPKKVKNKDSKTFDATTDEKEEPKIHVTEIREKIGYYGNQDDELLR